MALERTQPEACHSSPATPISPTKTVPPSPPLTASPPTSLSPLRRPLAKAHSRVKRRPALPQSVAVAFRHLQEAHRGQYIGPSWLRFSGVCPDDVEALVSATEAVGFKYRFDYEPSKQQLTLRMPEGSPHIFTKNGFARSILRGVEERLRVAMQEDDANTSLGSIRIASNVEGKVLFPSGEVKRPDVAFYFKGSHMPPLVVEIGHSQKARSLATVARDYIDKSDGAIHTVITARFVHVSADQRRQERHDARNRAPGRQARLTTRSQARQSSTGTTGSTPVIARSSLAHVSLYRLGKRVVHDQIFRNAQGQPADGGLELSVADFVPWDGALEDAGQDAARAQLEQLTFTVPFAEFCEALAWGEETQALEEQTPPPVVQPRTGQKRVHFDWSEPEPDASDDVNTDADADEDDRARSSSKRRRTSLSDASYRGPSRQDEDGRSDHELRAGGEEAVL